MMRPTWFRTATRWWDVLTVTTFLLFLHALLLGGIRVLWLSGGPESSAGLYVTLTEDPIDSVALHLRHRVKDQGDQVVSITRWERPLYAFLALLFLRLVLTLALAPADYRAKYRTGWRRLIPRAALSLILLLLLLLGVNAWLQRTTPPPATTGAIDLIQPGNDGQTTLQPGARASHAGVVVEVNRLGFRGPEIDPTASGPRILYLGDSFTFGFAVAEPDCFVRRSEAYLHANGYPEATVLNAGMWSYDTADEVQLLEDRVDEVRPDLVVLVFFMNDGMPNISLSRLQRRLYQEVDLYRRLFDLYYARFAQDAKYTPEAVNSAYRNGMPNWEESKAALARFREVATEQGFEPLVVIFPLLENLRDEGAYAPAHAAVQETLRGANIDFLDLSETFAGRDETELWYHTGDHHANAEGHRLAADAIGPWLESRLSKPRD